jgi:hypothetical protein
VRPYSSASVAALILVLASPLFSVPALVLGPGDLRIEQLSDGGYHLYVRAKAGLGSVLLTESTKDPAHKSDSFAYRALEKNAVNGAEKRVLGGKSISSSSDLHFLVDSTAEPDAFFGRAFHIFIPWVVAWGYPWSRSGKVFIHDGTFINIRTFAKPFADYRGGFADNPFVVRVSQTASRGPASATGTAPVASASVPASVPAAPVAPEPAFDAKLYIPETIAAFGAIAKASGGELRYASSDKDIVGQIDALLAREKGKSLDLVLCLDTTDTMANGIDALKARLPAALSRRLADFPSFRLGLVAFKDYFEEYLYKRFDFERDLGSFAAELDSLHAGGGRDIPEAVFEALYAAATEFDWSAQARLVVLVGDAPPHPLPRGSVDESAVDDAAASSGVEMDAVAVPK